MSDLFLEEKSGPKECLDPEVSFFKISSMTISIGLNVYIFILQLRNLINLEVDLNFFFNFQVLQQEQLQDYDLTHDVHLILLSTSVIKFQQK